MSVAIKCYAQDVRAKPEMVEAFAVALHADGKEEYLFNKNVNVLFAQASSGQLIDWKSSSDVSIRVLAHWSDARRTSGGEARTQRLALFKFVGAIEGSIAAAAPRWWHDAITEGRFQHVSKTSSTFEVSQDFFNSLSKVTKPPIGDISANATWNAGILTVPSTVLNIEGDVSLPVRTDGSPRTVIFQPDDEGGGILVCNSGSAICGAVARYRRDGHILWQRTLWGTIATDISGPVNVPCRIEVHLRNGLLTVWGGGYSTCYCEQFMIKSGEVNMRFITQL